MTGLSTVPQPPAFRNPPTVANPNFEAYGPYAELFNQTGTMRMDLSTITKDNIESHIKAIFSILLDGIETDQVQHMKIYVTFCDGVTIPLVIFDYFINLIFWKLPIYAGDLLTSIYLSFELNGFTQNSIKSYIDNLFLELHRTNHSNIWINNTIDDVMFEFTHIDEFSQFIMNTFNNEDTIELMKKDREFYDAIHCDISNVPLEDVKKVGDEAVAVAVDRITKSKTHWGVPYFKARQGINKKQYREYQVSFGIKPKGDGTIYPMAINQSYVNGALNDFGALVIDAGVARQSQILQKENVADSGSFARILGINNLDTRIHPDPHYVCNTKNFLMITVTDEDTLDRLRNRYYRLSRNGVEYKIPSNPMKARHLIGKMIYLRSPLTCASHARGEGYCYRCYGELAYINNDINPGKFAAEELTSQLTQKLLSAKHLLEASVRRMEWCKEVYMYFDFELNSITIIEGFDYKKFKLIIDSNDIEIDDEDDMMDQHMSVKQFYVQTPSGQIDKIYTETFDDIYISSNLVSMLTKKRLVDGKYVINMDTLDHDTELFMIKITNIELSQALNDVMSCINLQQVFSKLKTPHALTQKLLADVNRSGLVIDSVHLEVLLSNQVRDPDDILAMPQWEYENAPYQMVTLNTALTSNPSVAISLEYKKLAGALRSPLTFRKRKASPVDLFYIIQPQIYMNAEFEDSEKEDDGPVAPFVIQQDPNAIPGVADDDYLDQE